ncbi:MAG: roadblock/LC7 domain-containing protein [Candidatus Helarchaeota archaeon]
MSIPEEQIQIIQKLLSNLESHTELEATAVVTIEGMRIACAVSGDMDADVYSAASAALVSLGETTLKQLQHGSLKEIIVRGDDGYTILTRAGSSYMVVGSCKIGSRMGYYLALLHRFCKKVESILEPEGPYIGEPGAPAVTTSTQAPKKSVPNAAYQPVQQQVSNVSKSHAGDKVAIESALDALSMLEETEPPSSVVSGAPTTEIPQAPPTQEGYGESAGLEDALRTLGATDESSSAPKVDINTNALIDALQPTSAPKETPSTYPTQTTTPAPSTTSNDDIFNISDKEAVLEALKVLGWEEDENE